MWGGAADTNFPEERRNQQKGEPTTNVRGVEQRGT